MVDLFWLMSEKMLPFFDADALVILILYKEIQGSACESKREHGRFGDGIIRLAFCAFGLYESAVRDP